MIRVLVAEDSLTVRELLVAILESDPEVRVVGQAKDGAEAVRLTERLKPDVVTMDIEMPILDGLDATKEIMVRAPTPIVVVTASGSSAHVERSFDALRAGALLILEKPVDPHSPVFNGRRERFLSMVKAMAGVKVVRRWDRGAADGAPSVRRRGRPRVRLVVVAASTGGPAAVQRLLADLPGDFPAPVMVVQHIAPGFTDGLSAWLASGCHLRVTVPHHGEELRPRTVYLAPDGSHMGVTDDGRVLLSDDPPVGGHRPAADFLFRSAAAAFGPGVVGVVLTGMGSDGAAGAARIREAGGFVVAQDEATSVVFGMNREAVEAGGVDMVFGVEDLGAAVVDRVMAGEGAT